MKVVANLDICWRINLRIIINKRMPVLLRARLYIAHNARRISAAALPTAHCALQRTAPRASISLPRAPPRALHHT